MAKKHVDEFVKLLTELDQLNPERAREFVAEMKRETQKKGGR